jgi:hypothetical protein
MTSVSFDLGVLLQASRPPERAVAAWLRAGVPITLMCDLLFAEELRSREIYAVEAVVDDVRRSEKLARKASAAASVRAFVPATGSG